MIWYSSSDQPSDISITRLCAFWCLCDAALFIASSPLCSLFVLSRLCRRTVQTWNVNSTLPKRNQPWCARSWPNWWRTARPWRRSWPSTGRSTETSTPPSPWRRWGNDGAPENTWQFATETFEPFALLKMKAWRIRRWITFLCSSHL